VAKWVRRADLMRIAGVDYDLGELIELAGVRSVGELAARMPMACTDGSRRPTQSAISCANCRQSTL